MTILTVTRRASRTIIWLIALGLLAIVLVSILPISLFFQLGSRLNLFATVFLGIFIEALPYLLLGTFISGLVEVFLDRELMARFISRRLVPAAITGAFMGLVFPVCECGVIPLTRRLFRKGLPLSAGVAFLLAAPVMNPIVIFSTAAAFGWGPMLFWRLGLSLLIANQPGYIYNNPQWDPWGRALVFQQFKLKGVYKPEIGMWMPGLDEPLILAEGILAQWLP